MKLVLAAFLMFWSSVVSGQSVNQSYPPPGKLIDVGGYRLHLNCTGNKGPTVVLIPGAGDFSFDWSLVQPSIAKFARVCSFDRAGFAWSDPGPNPRTMKQEAFELHTLLQAAQVKGPYVLVAHSIGGLMARIYAAQYGQEVAGLVLIDSLHEDTTVGYQGKLVHLREMAKSDPVPPIQTMKSSSPKPVTKEDLDQFEKNLKSHPPRIGAPFDKLPPAIQAMRLWVLSQPPRTSVAGGLNFLPEELRDIYEAREKKPEEFGDLPLMVILRKDYGPPPAGVDPEEWRRLNEPKQQQKLDFPKLSRNSKLVFADSGHHIQLDRPEIVIDAVRLVVESSRQHRTLDGKKL